MLTAALATEVAVFERVGVVVTTVVRTETATEAVAMVTLADDEAAVLAKVDLAGFCCGRVDDILVSFSFSSSASEEKAESSSEELSSTSSESEELSTSPSESEELSAFSSESDGTAASEVFCRFDCCVFLP